MFLMKNEFQWDFKKNKIFDLLSADNSDSHVRTYILFTPMLTIIYYLSLSCLTHLVVSPISDSVVDLSLAPPAP